MTRISNISNLLLCATAGAVATLSLQSAASATTLSFSGTANAAESASTITPAVPSITLNDNYNAVTDTLSFNATGTVNLNNQGGAVSPYVTNAAGILTAAAPSYGLSTGGSLIGPNSANFGSILVGNGSIGYFKLFSTTSTATSLSTGTVTLSSIFGSQSSLLTNGTTLYFKVNDTTYGDNVGSFAFNGTLSNTAVPEPFTIIGTLVGGTAAFRMRKKLQAVNK
jgi:hypothetical protein